MQQDRALPDYSASAYGASNAPRRVLKRRRNSLLVRFRAVVRPAKRILEGMLFLARFIRAPRSVGSVFPSSRFLGHAMVADLPADGEVYVELGGGTGSLTQAILAAGVPREKLIVVERDPHFVAHLRKRFPRVLVIEGDGQELTRILAEAGIDRVSAVVSGLPFRSLPNSVCRRLAAESFAVLQPGGSFVQFTYWGEPPIPRDVIGEYGVSRSRTGRVWRNLPPAQVWRYQRPEDDVQAVAAE